MYGLIFHNLQTALIERFGQDTYAEIRKLAGLEEHVFCVHKQYSDDILMRIVDSAAEVTKCSKDEILHDMGRHFPRFCGESGYYKIMKTVGRNLKEFLNGLDHMHECLRYSYPGMRSPSFYCDQETESGLRLHYRSKRRGYIKYVQGQIEEIASYLFNITATVELESLEDDPEGDHAILKILFKNTVEKRKTSTGMDRVCPMVSTNLIFQMFPFHLMFQRDLVVFGVGNSLFKILPHISGRVLTDCFQLHRPVIALTWNNGFLDVFSEGFEKIFSKSMGLLEISGDFWRLPAT
eukprot:gene12302-13571_t